MIPTARATGFAAMLLAVFAAHAVETLHIAASKNGDVYVLDAEVRLDAPIARVHAFITDYDHLTRLSDHVKESRVVAVEANSTLVFTRLERCIAFFCRTIERVERVIEFSPGHVEANTLPERSNVKYGKVVWDLERDGDMGTLVKYYMAMQPDFWIPPFIGRFAVQRSMRSEAAALFERIEELAAAEADGE